ncbi:GPR1/FUN34/YaaH family transporter [Streptomyces sp. MA5143a]|uniref:GPR1/FUN34/YaaH family transporter n=1 Tax=Streptomyces sp. MA5143a TaxID=2083010 RepID=UPI000D1BE23F|nr:GPR1/FUN34/YaaH family transporter [Streptomyces sp. MA5143a]SPF03336.1 GPR1/FUN34/yaaH family protein [Streptomyces sp. MA5143a]
MDNDVSAGSNTTTLGQLALGLTLLAFGLGHTRMIDGLTEADAGPLAAYVGGVALFVAGLLAFRDRDGFTGTAYAGLGALWFTWSVGDLGSTDATGLFLLLFALVALSLTLGASGAATLTRATYGLLCAAMLLLAVASFGDSGGLAKAGGWVAAVGGLVAWYAATAALAHWPTTLTGRAAGRGVTATG